MKQSKNYIDASTFIGIGVTFVLIISAILLGKGNPLAFINIQSVMIVLLGTFAVTAACFSIKEVFKSFAIIGKTMFYRPPNSANSSMLAIEIADISHKKGILELENSFFKIKNDPFLKKCVRKLQSGIGGRYL